jgi:putative copper export protein
VLDNAYVRITNNFMHDMATGTWAACLAVLLVLSPRLVGMPAEASAAVGDAMMLVFWLLLVALAVVTATGAVRLVYWRAQTPADELTAKRRALVVKHIAFLVIYGGGTVFGWTLLP